MNGSVGTYFDFENVLFFRFCFSHSRNFFERYRSLNKNVVPPKTFADCAKVFTDCKDAEQFDGGDEEEQAEHEEHEEPEGAGDSAEEITTEFTTETNEDDNKIIRRKRFNDFFQI